MSDDADLVTCLDAVQECYLLADSARDGISSLTENREALRLFASIGDPDLREAVLSLLRVLAWPADAIASSAPSAPTRPAANRPA